MIPNRIRLISDSLSDIPYNESYFSFLAKKGLHLKSVSSPFACFQKGDPVNMRYRIDVLEKEPEEEQLEIYQQSGWELVCHQKEYYVFRSLVNNNAPELHTDPAEQAYTLIKIEKQMKLSLFITVLLFFVSILSFYIYIQRETLLVLSFIEGRLLQLILILIFIVVHLVESIRKYLTLSKLKNNLSQRIPMNHNVNWRFYRAWNFIPFITSFTYILLLVAMTFSQESSSYPLPQVNDGSSPSIRLSDLESTLSLQPYEKYRHNNNTVITDSSFLVDKHYVINESKISEDRTWLNQNSLYAPSINTIFYQLRYQSFSKPLAKDLLKKYADIYNYNSEQIKVIEDSRFDILYSVDSNDKNTQVIAAALNDSTIFIHYNGEETLEQLINETASLLESY